VHVEEALRIYDNVYIKEARRYIQEHCTTPYGQGDEYYYATTREEAKQVLRTFLEQRFALFGPYEDAIQQEGHILFHSMISPYINNGLLTPEYVVTTTLLYAEEHTIEIASLEGFIRQVIGWREFIRGVYVVAGVKQRKRNFFGYTKKLPASFWNGTTGILPIDTTIKKVEKTAYLHHIERLMVMGNYMLLNEYSPDEMYRWFMELFIDAYDWVMVPNVYGMVSYSDGGMMTTKPYISGANYILKMSDYKKGEWGDMWTKLYWDFVTKHQELFINNPRMRMLITKHGNE
jgi:deoxyribodipyrimidine photolyase-related protein